MKICTVVGVRKSGKTTTVIGLITELKRRGYRVGTVKSVFCPSFTIDTDGSNSRRHREAGADIVCVKGKQEMDILLPPNADGNFYENLPVDYLILEGEYELCVPRIICAHKEEEIEERITEDTVAAAGRIAQKLKNWGNLPVYHSLEQTEELADLVENLPETEFPLTKRPVPGAASAFCQCGCHKTEKKQMEKAKPLTANPRHNGHKHIFLTGEKGVGKSTLLKRLLDGCSKETSGYVTLPYRINGVQKGYYMHSLTPVGEYENDSPVMIRRSEKKMTAIPQTFETLGISVIEAALSSLDKIAVLDELGKAEKHAPLFQQAVFHLLDEHNLVLGVLQKGAGDFVEAAASRPDVEVYEVTEENRENLYPVLKEKIMKIL